MTNYYIRMLLLYLPQFTYGIVQGILLYLAFLTGRAVALNHLLKHHLPDIKDDEFQVLLTENKKLTAENKTLKEDNELYKKTLRRIRYSIRKEIV